MQSHDRASSGQHLHLGDGARGDRPFARSMRRGFFNRCPNCGEGRMFARFLKVADACSACGEELHHHRADDFPPYIVVTIVGHLVLGGFMMTEMILTLSNWQHLAIWVPVTILASLLLMQPVKGSVVGLQWALRMHGFGEHGFGEHGTDGVDDTRDGERPSPGRP